MSRNESLLAIAAVFGTFAWVLYGENDPEIWGALFWTSLSVNAVLYLALMRKNRPLDNPLDKSAKR